jgi:hypothetical protein
MISLDRHKTAFGEAKSPFVGDQSATLPLSDCGRVRHQSPNLQLESASLRKIQFAHNNLKSGLRAQRIISRPDFQPK